MPKVSVIIPVYNVEKYLRECLDSIVGQTLPDIEIICVDDGSTDRSPEILQEYQEKDPRIKVLTQENKGQSAARNAGLRQARGEYIYFMDSDDVLELSALNILYKKSTDNQLDVLYFDAKVIFENEQTARRRKWYKNFYVRKKEYSGITSGANLFARMKLNGEYRVQPCLQFVRRDYWQKLNLFFAEGMYLEDILFNFQCMLQAARVSHIRQELFIRRINEGSTMTKKKTFKHFYGAFTAYAGISDFIAERTLAGDVRTAVLKEQADILDSAISTYDLLDTAEKRKTQLLSPAEKQCFADMLAQNSSWQSKLQRQKAVVLRKIKDFVLLFFK